MHTNIYLVGGLEHEFYFSRYWEESSQLTFTPSFFRWVGQPSTSYIFNYIIQSNPTDKKYSTLDGQFPWWKWVRG